MWVGILAPPLPVWPLWASVSSSVKWGLVTAPSVKIAGWLSVFLRVNPSRHARHMLRLITVTVIVHYLPQQPWGRQT